MEWTGLNELREKFLAFFESKGHLRLPSFPLVPQGDASLLLIGAGMAPMKKYFTGEIAPPSVRVCTCQKCIRTVDIENVGKTARHCTYFEMLGNFSFGEYFKREAITWAWEFFTDVLKMDKGKLYPTIFTKDDEAWDIWAKETDVAQDHIVRLDDNFWEHGQGPCGPDSELHYDRGEKYGCGSPDCKPGCDCDRYIEVWNLVFTQFDSDGAGNYTMLDSKNIDTGMSVERLACVMQGVDSVFEVDTFQSVMKHVIEISGVEYHADAKNDISLRVITEHARATVMMVGDGVLPSNEGRGYVLRRLLRRAARHGRLLGIKRPFLSEVAVTVIGENKGAYPALAEKQDFILKVIANEEENFSRTIDAGLQLLGRMMADAGGDVLSGADAFKLSDTYGFPIDLTKEILAENNMTVDEDAYKALMLGQRERSRAARKEAGGWDSEGGEFQGLPATQFVGYEQDGCEATVLAVFDDAVVLDKTPFYAESGGQCGDAGTIGDFKVTATTKSAGGVILHRGEGELQAGGTVLAQVVYRPAIRANHTAAHLLHAALREVLGNHVEQAGQSVAHDGLRFDFTHFAALTKNELRRVEFMVNEAIWQALDVETEVLPIEEAKARGAMALFGEKYGDTVRMVSVPGVSAELCGGTHAANTGELGMFVITSESSVASGVRRIEAVTRYDAYDAHRTAKAEMKSAAEILKANNTNELEARAQAVMAQLKEAEKALAAAQEKLSGYAVRELMDSAEEIGGVKFVRGEVAGDARQACDIAKQGGSAMAALFARKTDKGLQFAAACSPGAVRAGAHAGNLVRAAAQAAGGSGGGKPDSAMAGGRDASKLGEALKAGEAALRAALK
ncbi:MAG: alanine--tRNA ligase [Oscillospiraceae bacterium]|jgi:alanyl-tRNA synthetase|nr:alanine--tRNA ligase [Oscillospiraceae bacterium]